MANDDNRRQEQAKRLVYICREIMCGKILTTASLQSVFDDMFGGEITLRTIQRDLRLLQECLPTVEQVREGREVYWKLSSSHLNTKSIIRVDNNELLSFHILKSNLKTFAGTEIEKEMKALESKLERLAPGDVYFGESLFWDQNAGIYDYSGHSGILGDVISGIVNRRWLHLKYYSVKQNTTKKYNVLLRGLFTYAGSLYAVAYYPRYDKHESIAVQGVKSVEYARKNYGEPPPFDFNEFTKKRYGVFSSEPKNIKLLINKEMAGYFDGRRWHRTQKTSYDEAGNFIIEMKVPIGMDLVSWILGWNECILVLEPPELREKVVAKLRGALGRYGETAKVSNS